MASNTLRTCRRTLLLTLALLTVAGCTRRKETIRIEPDGRMHLTLEFKGGPHDLNEGDAMLSDPGPWKVEEHTVTEDNKEKLVRQAHLIVEPGQDVPTHYAGYDLDLAGLSLRVSTTLQTERRRDGVYYHFRRVYHRRNWAYIDYFRRHYLESGFDKLENKDPEELTRQDREEIAQALITFEGVKMLKLAEAAAEALRPTLRQDDWLAVHAGFVEVFENIDEDQVVRILEMPDVEASEEIKRTVAELNVRIETMVGRVLDERDRTGGLSQMFLDQFDRERRRQAISEDLADDHFEVTVQMPGRLVGSNTFDAAEGNEVDWEFDGDALYDADVVLMATSVVERK